MSLTVGSGPFGRWPAGTFNTELPPRERLLYFEDSPRWVRTRLRGKTVADSRQMKLLHEHGRLPVYYFPEHDVRIELLAESDRVEESELKGRTVYWHVRAGASTAENAAYAHPEPPDEAAFLRGYVAFDFDAMEEWLEEEERIEVHPKDPYSRVDVLRTSRRVRVAVDGELLAESDRPLVLFESGLPPRWYLPQDDVRMDLLTPSEKRTMCPYKGRASYFDARVNGRVEEGLVWTYEEPGHDAADVKGYVAFFDERVDLEIDGEPVERPTTQWSASG